MNFVNLLVRMFARQAIFRSGHKLLGGFGKKNNVRELEEIDTSEMTPKERHRHNNKIARRRQNQQSMNKTSPWIYVLLIIIGLLVLYISTLKK